MENNEKFEILILAAGFGKRMNSDKPKALLEVNGKPMIQYLIDAINQAFNKKPITIVGHGVEMIKEYLGDSSMYALQEQQLGTGHAVMSGKNTCGDAKQIIVLSGDQPFITPETLKGLLDKQINSGAKITFTTTEIPDFEDWRSGFLSFGRIIRVNNEVDSIREYKDANDEEKNIKEVNAGCYVFEAPWLWENLEKVKNDNSQQEYYLTDLLHIAKEEGEKIETIQIDPREALGANKREELEILKQNIL